MNKLPPPWQLRGSKGRLTVSVPIAVAAGFADAARARGLTSTEYASFLMVTASLSLDRALLKEVK